MKYLNAAAAVVGGAIRGAIVLVSAPAWLPVYCVVKFCDWVDRRLA